MATIDEDRRTFLIEMYKEMWDNINRHIGVIWQSVTVLVGAGAVFGLVEKTVIPIDYATTLIVVVAAWQIAHVFDASYWVNRNLLIVRNIEAQFLKPSDLKDIHYYFRAVRPNKLIEHFWIQFALGSVVAVLAMVYHATKQRMWICAEWQAVKFLPYIVLIVGVCGAAIIKARHDRSYKRLVERSPGARVEVDA